jgi:hypothetical protein
VAAHESTIAERLRRFAAGATALALPATAPPRVPITPWPQLGLGRSIEAWGLAAGVRQVAFLTVEPAAEAAAAASFGDAHVVRRERRVAVSAQDRWDDRRDHGAPRVELYAAHDHALAERAAALQSDDPTRHAAALGELFGYPRCCIDAFVAQGDRSSNTLNRYLTAARTGGDGPWPWLLNDLHLRLIAFYPCRYDCAAARAVATATLDAIAGAEVAALRAALTAAVVYVDHDHQVWLRDDLCYRAVTAVGVGVALPRLAALFAGGDRLAIDGAGLTVTAADRPIARLATDRDPPWLVARFA